MPGTRLLVAAGAALAIGVGAAASTGAVKVTVKPRGAIAGERITVLARADRGAGRCTAQMTRPGAPATALPPKTPARGLVSWKWTVPVSAKTGTSSARVTCRRSGSGQGRFSVRALPAGDPDAGKTVFLLNCGGCHTLTDAGTQGTSVDLDQKQPSYERTVDRVVNGRRLMPSFKTRLTAQQIADVSAYVARAVATP